MTSAQDIETRRAIYAHLLTVGKRMTAQGLARALRLQDAKVRAGLEALRKCDAPCVRQLSDSSWMALR